LFTGGYYWDRLLGIAFMPKDELAVIAKNIVTKPDLLEVLNFPG